MAEGAKNNVATNRQDFRVSASFCARTQVMQQLLGSVLRGLEVEELLVLVDELGVHGGVEELVVGQHVLEERDVGLEKGGERGGENSVCDFARLAHALWKK